MFTVLSFFSCLFSIPISTSIGLVKVKLLSRVRLFATPWTVAYQAPLVTPTQSFLVSHDLGRFEKYSHVLFKLIFLEYSWFTMLCQFQAHSKVNQYIYVYIKFSSLWYTVGSYQLYTFYTVVRIVNPSLPIYLPLLPPW